jgi:hypothetical protein
LLPVGRSEPFRSGKAGYIRGVSHVPLCRPNEKAAS